MRIEIGKHKGKYSEDFLFNDPGYIRWVLFTLDAKGPLIELREGVIEQITMFDKKTFTRRCNHCGKQAKLAMVTGDVFESVCWLCDNCKYDEPQATSRIMEQYVDCLFFSLDDDLCLAMLRRLANAKGLYKFGGDDVHDFLGGK